MIVYIGYTLWRHVGPHPRTVYVVNLPGDGGKDWGYTYHRVEAIPLSVYWRRRFEADMRRCNSVAAFVPIDNGPAPEYRALLDASDIRES